MDEGELRRQWSSTDLPVRMQLWAQVQHDDHVVIAAALADQLPETWTTPGDRDLGDLDSPDGWWTFQVAGDKPMSREDAARAKWTSSLNPDVRDFIRSLPDVS